MEQPQLSTNYIMQGTESNSCIEGVSSPEDLSPQMEQRRFWESIGPGLWDDSCFKPNGGFTSSELLTAWSPDMDTVELI